MYQCIYCRKGMPGFAIGAKEDKLGIRASTRTLLFTDVKVPKKIELARMVLGLFAMETLSGGRIGIAAQALGIAAGAYELP